MENLFQLFNKLRERKLYQRYGAVIWSDREKDYFWRKYADSNKQVILDQKVFTTEFTSHIHTVDNPIAFLI